MLTTVLPHALYKKPLIISREEQVTPTMEFPTAFVGGNKNDNTIAVYV